MNPALPTPPDSPTPTVYEVIVGNVGRVHTGADYDTAQQEYQAYCEISRSHYGRAGGEAVTLMADGEILDEHPNPAEE